MDYGRARRSRQVVSNGQEFAWVFDGMSSSFKLSKVAPTGVLDRDLTVYVWPNARDLADK